MESPPEFIYLNPVKIRRKSAKNPTKASKAETTLEKIAGIQLIVATPSFTHSPQALNIIKEYQRRKEKTRIAEVI